jgi:D-alanyl-D-alanine carboxypeptidase
MRLQCGSVGVITKSKAGSTNAERRRFGSICLLILMVPCMSVFASAITNEKGHAAEEYLKSLLDEHKTPGLQYMLVDADHVLFRFNGGYADLGQKIPIQNNTTFVGYSITKTFTAAAVVKLAIEGKIDLDELISAYVDDLPFPKSPTIRQTLQHMGGFPNPNPLPWIHLAEEHENFDKRAFVDELTLKHAVLESNPGEKFSYSNIGYLLLGEIVRKASRMPYDEYVLAEIIGPLSLVEDQRISFVIDHPDTHAHGYIRKWNWLNLVLGWFIDRDTFLEPSIDGWTQFRDFLVNGEPYGGLVGTASGFARYLQAALRVEKPFAREMLDLMWQAGTAHSGARGGMGLGWRYGFLDGERYFTHTGGGGGYYCEIRVYPDATRASVIMTNNTGISNRHYLDRMDRHFLDNAD